MFLNIIQDLNGLWHGLDHINDKLLSADIDNTDLKQHVATALHHIAIACAALDAAQATLTED